MPRTRALNREEIHPWTTRKQITSDRPGVQRTRTVGFYYFPFHPWNEIIILHQVQFIAIIIRPWKRVPSSNEKINKRKEKNPSNSNLEQTRFRGMSEILTELEQIFWRARFQAKILMFDYWKKEELALEWKRIVRGIVDNLQESERIDRSSDDGGSWRRIRLGRKIVLTRKIGWTAVDN